MWLHSVGSKLKGERLSEPFLSLVGLIVSKRRYLYKGAKSSFQWREQHTRSLFYPLSHPMVNPSLLSPFHLFLPSEWSPLEQPWLLIQWETSVSVPLIRVLLQWLFLLVWREKMMKEAVCTSLDHLQHGRTSNRGLDSILLLGDRRKKDCRPTIFRWSKWSKTIDSHLQLKIWLWWCKKSIYYGATEITFFSVLLLLFQLRSQRGRHFCSKRRRSEDSSRGILTYFHISTSANFFLEHLWPKFRPSSIFTYNDSVARRWCNYGNFWGN